MVTTPDRHTVPKRSAKAAWQVVDHELVILRTDAQELMGVNESARHLWELVDGTRDLDMIATELARHYRQPVNRVRDDVVVFVAELAELGVLTLVSPEVSDGR